MKTKFCRYCGKKLEEKPTRYEQYDEATGKRDTRMVCTNQNCQGYCDYLGCNYTGFWIFKRCSRCGMPASSGSGYMFGDF